MSPPPLRPGKIVAVGLNYRAHVAEGNRAVPDEPVLFLKPPSAIIGPDEAIVRPRGLGRIDFEGELAIVIGTRCRAVPRARALEVVRGYVCLNDVSARALQAKDGQWIRAKGFDTFCPLGPRVAEGLDPSALRLETRVNGEVRQQASTADLIFDVPTLVELVSRVMTLEVDDVISTGTPAGVGNMAAGDVVEIEIEGIGVLRNPVVEEA